MPARWRAAAVGLGGGVTSGGAGGTVLAFLCRMVCKNSVFVNADSSETPDNQTNRGKATQFRRFFVSGLKIQTETKPDNQTSTSSVCLVFPLFVWWLDLHQTRRKPRNFAVFLPACLVVLFVLWFLLLEIRGDVEQAFIFALLVDLNLISRLHRLQKRLQFLCGSQSMDILDFSL